MRYVVAAAFLLTVAFSVLLAGPAAAAPRGGCENAAPVDLAAAMEAKDGTVAHAWGRRNLSSLPADPDSNGPVFRIAYPAGSFSPGRSQVRGGAGFEFGKAGARDGCLSYRVRFPLGFDFVKGGKLPGLFGGDAPRGCVGKDEATGFSARLMWREAGAGELYLYAPGREQRCGASIGRGSFAFARGNWVQVMERVSVGAPGEANGTVEVWVDGRLAVRADGLTLGAGRAATVDGLLFATFFGGDDESWASPHAQYVDFSDVRLSSPHARP